MDKNNWTNSDLDLIRTQSFKKRVKFEQGHQTTDFFAQEVEIYRKEVTLDEDDFKDDIQISDTSFQDS